MSSAPPASPGSTGARLGAYELLAPLGQGGTAEVFLARFAGAGGFEKLVVVKRLLPHLVNEREFVDMFLDEARLGARLDQSNIVQTIELGAADDQYFIALEYVPGMSLQQLARRAQRRGEVLPPAIVLSLAVQACAGLHYAHERREPDGTPLALVHRDISPQNLVVNHEGVLKILDFGIAHASAEARDARTKTGFIKGKFAYMSPEQCLGKKVDRRTDVFALGTVVHELLTGRRLFKRDTTYRTYQAIVGGEVTVPSAVNPALGPRYDAVVLKALSMLPEERYQTAEAFGEALEALLHGLGKVGTSGEVARYLEQHFGEDIAQQDRMVAEILSGQRTSLGPARWDGGEADPDTSDDGAEELSVAELLEASDVQEIDDADFDDAEDTGVEHTPRPRRVGGDTTPRPIRAVADMSLRGQPAARKEISAPVPIPAARAKPTDPPQATPAPVLTSLTASEDQPTVQAASANRVVLPDHLASLGQHGTATLPVARPVADRPIWVYAVYFVVAVGVGLAGMVLVHLFR